MKKADNCFFSKGKVWAISLLLLLLSLCMPIKSAYASDTAISVKNPVHNHDKDKNSNDTTKWSYLYFGSYPQEEITDSATIAKIDKAISAAGLTDGDV